MEDIFVSSSEKNYSKKFVCFFSSSSVIGLSPPFHYCVNNHTIYPYKLKRRFIDCPCGTQVCLCWAAQAQLQLSSLERHIHPFRACMQNTLEPWPKLGFLAATLGIFF